MTYSSNEKNIAIAISLSIAFAFAGTTNVNAEDRFPPAHTTGIFKESKQASAAKVQGGYYRENYRPNAGENTVVRLQAGRYDVAIAGAGIAPYYRAAN